MFLKLEQTADEGFDKSHFECVLFVCVCSISSCGMKSISWLSNTAAFNQWPNLKAADKILWIPKST